MCMMNKNEHKKVHFFENIWFYCDGMFVQLILYVYEINFNVKSLWTANKKFTHEYFIHGVVGVLIIEMHELF